MQIVEETKQEKTGQEGVHAHAKALLTKKISESETEVETLKTQNTDLNKRCTEQESKISSLEIH